MKKKRFTEQQIIGLEAEADVSVTEFCRKHGFSDVAFYGWRGAMRGMGSIRGRGVDRGTLSGIENADETSAFPGCPSAQTQAGQNPPS